MVEPIGATGDTGDTGATGTIETIEAVAATGETGATGPVEAPAPPATPPTPAQVLAQAHDAYLKALTAAAAPDPKAKELRDAARALWAQADAIDGPEKIAARQTAQQFTQFMRRGGQQHRQPGAPVAKKP